MRLGWFLAVAVMATTPSAWAKFISAPDVVLFCDPDIAHACEAVGAEFRVRTGVPVRVHAAPGPQQLALIARGTRTDVLMTLTPLLDDAASRHLLSDDRRAGPWRDALVLGGREAAGAQAAGPLALVDPTEPGSLDGAAVARRLGWHPAATVGALDGTEVAWMLAHFAAGRGVLARSALLAEPSLTTLATLPPDAYPPISYSAALVHQVLSRNAAGFLAFLETAAARAALAHAGLERLP